MIRHIVFFSAAKSEDAVRIADELGALAAIPHAELFEIGVNRKIDHASSEVDVIVYGEFRNEAALAAYKAHPVYEAVTAKVRPLRAMRIAADFVSKTESSTPS